MDTKQLLELIFIIQHMVANFQMDGFQLKIWKTGKNNMAYDDDR